MEINLIIFTFFNVLNVVIRHEIFYFEAKPTKTVQRQGLNEQSVTVAIIIVFYTAKETNNNNRYFDQSNKLQHWSMWTLNAILLYVVFRLQTWSGNFFGKLTWLIKNHE